MFGNSLCHPVKNTFQIVQLSSILYFHDNNLTLTVFSFNIHPVEFIINRHLVTLAFKQFYNFHLLAQQHREESLQNPEISFLTQ